MTLLPASRGRPRSLAPHLQVSLVSLLVLGCLVGAVAPTPAASALPSARRPHHPYARRVVVATVRPGDTLTGIAERRHAWTAELMAANGLAPTSTLRIGQRLRVPVDVVAARRARRHHRRHRHRIHWRHGAMSQRSIRRVIARKSRRHHIPVGIPLAVGWRESGWRQRQVSSTGALGVMQVLPSTGRWISTALAHRRLNLRETHQNIAAGVLYLQFLRDQTVTDRRAIAAYYQGLTGIRRHRFYGDTWRYVHSVETTRRHLRHTGRPY